jgi:exopolysaccharide production protein ExoZ
MLSPKQPHGIVLSSLQSLRGLAAIAVVLYHTRIILAQPEYGGYDILREIASRGWVGVNLFFVLSGFIIIYAHSHELGRPDRIKNYIWRRFVRLYPVYWVVLAVYIVATLLKVAPTKFEWGFLNILSVVALVKLKEPITLPLQVAWTLFYEIGFYAVFMLLIANRRLGIAAMTLWLLCILVNGLVLRDVSMGIFHMWNIYFFFGLLVFFLYQRLDNRFGMRILVVGIISLVAILWLIVGERINDAQKDPLVLLALAPPFALCLLGSALAERAGAFRVNPMLVLFGTASYSIYLVHSPAISLIAILNRKIGFGVIPPYLLFAVAFVGSIVVGMVVHWFVEKPLLEWLRRLRPNANPTKQQAA